MSQQKVEGHPEAGRWRRTLLGAPQACLPCGVQAAGEEMGLHCCLFPSLCQEGSLTNPRNGSAGKQGGPKEALQLLCSPGAVGTSAACGVLHAAGGRRENTPCRESPFAFRSGSCSRKPEVLGQGEGRRPAAPGQERDAISPLSFPELRGAGNKGTQIMKAIPAGCSLGRWPSSTRGHHELCFLAA